MRWQQGRRSENVDDRRGMGLPGGGLKIGGLGLIIVVVVSLLTGQNPLKLLGLIMEQQQTTQVNPPPGGQTGPQANDPQKEFIATVLADTEDTWSQVFQQMGRTYEKPRLVLFSTAVQSACGTASSASGPFYCPLDSQVYLDLDFFAELDRRFGAPGDFAQAYVVAHEVGHHVQNQLGIAEKVHSLQERSRNQEEANSLSVRMELQADCLAGVWGFYAKQRQVLESGDVEEGLAAAAAVGDDRIQRQAGRSISPESWTHGSSEMRVSWFNRGFQSGQINSCDTFQSSNL